MLITFYFVVFVVFNKLYICTSNQLRICLMSNKKTSKTRKPVVIQNVTFTLFANDSINNTDARVLKPCLEIIEKQFNLDLTLYSHFEYAYSILKMQASWN